MPRRKKTPCEWCEQEQIFRTDCDARNVTGTVEVYPNECLLSVYFQGMNDDGELTHEESVEIPMNFCPNCGRKLGW